MVHIFRNDAVFWKPLPLLVCISTVNKALQDLNRALQKQKWAAEDLHKQSSRLLLLHFFERSLPIHRRDTFRNDGSYFKDTFHMWPSILTWIGQTTSWQNNPREHVTTVVKVPLHSFMQGEHGEAAGDLYSQTRHGGIPHAVPNPDDPNYSHFKEVLWWKFVTYWSADLYGCVSVAWFFPHSHVSSDVLQSKGASVVNQ